jgi:CubicO group peptidase (beta-lactamase class C family)
MSIEAELERAVTDGIFPGAQLAIHAPDLDLSLAVGKTALPDFPPSIDVTPATRFDIASLTKALCTSVLLMQAIDEGRIRLETSIAHWYPNLAAADQIPVELLTRHRSGLVAHRTFYETIREEGPMGVDEARSRMRELILSEPLAERPGKKTVYSDLGFMLLGWILESCLGGGLDELFRDRISGPLGLQSTSYGPVPGPVAATEADENGEMLRGTVHDENARSIGGVAGHAGLFSTADEVLRIVGHLADVHAGRPGIVSHGIIRKLWSDTAERFTSGGWDTPSEPSSSGRYTTRGRSVGHLGYAGCSIWLDRARDVTIVLLSNRVHPTRENRAITTFRPFIHDRINRSLSGS